MEQISQMELIQQRIKDYKSFDRAIVYYVDSINEQELELAEIEQLVKKKLEILNGNNRITEILKDCGKIDLIDLQREVIIRG